MIVGNVTMGTSSDGMWNMGPDFYIWDVHGCGDVDVTKMGWAA